MRVLLFLFCSLLPSFCTVQYAHNTELKGPAISLMFAVFFVNINRANNKICLLLQMGLLMWLIKYVCGSVGKWYKKRWYWNNNLNTRHRIHNLKERVDMHQRVVMHQFTTTLSRKAAAECNSNCGNKLLYLTLFFALKWGCVLQDWYEQVLELCKVKVGLKEEDPPHPSSFLPHLTVCPLRA